MNYQLSSDNIYVPKIPVTHRNEEFDQGGFEVLQEMQL